MRPEEAKAMGPGPTHGWMKRGQRRRLLGALREAGADISELVARDGLGNGASSRERGPTTRSDVMELCSVPRVGPAAEVAGLGNAGAYDIMTGCDLRTGQGQQQVWRELQERKPRCTVMSPPCGPFSALQELTSGPWSSERRQRLRDAVAILRFCMRVAEHQVKRGAYFLFEHPLTAKSWRLKEVQDVWTMPGVRRVTGHLCMLGKKSAEGGPLEEGDRLA